MCIRDRHRGSLKCIVKGFLAPEGDSVNVAGCPRAHLLRRQAARRDTGGRQSGPLGVIYWVRQREPPPDAPLRARPGTYEAAVLQVWLTGSLVDFRDGARAVDTRGGRALHRPSR